MFDDRWFAVWGSYGTAAIAMIATLFGAWLVLRRAKRELEALKSERSK